MEMELRGKKYLMMYVSLALFGAAVVGNLVLAHAPSVHYPNLGIFPMIVGIVSAAVILTVAPRISETFRLSNDLVQGITTLAMSGAIYSWIAIVITAITNAHLNF